MELLLSQLNMENIEVGKCLSSLYESLKTNQKVMIKLKWYYNAFLSWDGSYFS